MRRVAGLVLGLVLVGSLAACGSSEDPVVDAGSDASDAKVDGSTQSDADVGEPTDADVGSDVDGGCEKRCEGRECGPDGCGGQCGTCKSSFECNEETGKCNCDSPSEEELCATQTVCGLPLTIKDKCDRNQIVECSCPQGQYCDDSNTCKTCVEESDNDFCLRHGVHCGDLTEFDTCQVERTVTCNVCPDTWSCGGAPNYYCEKEGVPSNDLCFQPSPLGVLALGVPMTFEASTVGASGEMTAICGGAGPEVFYSFELVADALVQVRIAPKTALTPVHVPLAYILPASCSQAGGELACGAPASPGIAHRLMPGTYVIAIDGESINYPNGEEAIVDLFASEAVVSENCFSAMELDLSTVPTLTLVASTQELANDSTPPPSCDPNTDPGGGGDMAFSVKLPEVGGPFSIEAKVAPTGVSNSYRPVLYAYAGCEGNPALLGCNLEVGSPARDAELTLSGLEAGSPVVLWVDSRKGQFEGLFRLTVTVRNTNPPPNDTFDTAISLNPSNLPSGIPEKDSGAPVATPDWETTVNVSTRDAKDDTRPMNCRYGSRSVSAADVFYKFTLDRTMSVRALLAKTGSVDLALSLVKGGATWADTQKNIDAFTPCEEVVEPFIDTNVWGYQLSPGTYYVIVDGVGGKQGEALLNVQFWAEFRGFCNGVEIPIDPVTEKGSAVGFMSAAEQNGANRCYSYTGTHFKYKSLVYSFRTPPGDEKVDVLIKATAFDVSPHNPDGWTRPSLSIRTSCSGEQSSCAGNETHYNQEPQRRFIELPVRGLDAGTLFYVIVQNDDAFEYQRPEVPVDDKGMVQVDVQIGGLPPLPFNDRCEQAEELTFLPSVARADGTTEQAKGDYTSNCMGATEAAASGPELVYSFELYETSDVTVEATYETVATLPLVYVRRGNCESFAAEVGCYRKDPSPTGVVTLRIPALARNEAGERYYVFVDSTVASATSKFSLSVTKTPVSLMSSNDTCDMAVDKGTIAVGGSLVIDGTTIGAFDDYQGDCQNSGTRTLHNGSDVVYKFKAGGDMYASIKVTSTAPTRDTANAIVFDSYAPAVYLRPWSSCVSNDDLPTRMCGQIVWDSVKTGPKNEPAQVIASWLREGEEYALIVDGVNGTQGAFQVEIATSGDVQKNDSCLGAEPLEIDGNGRAVVRGNTSLVNNDTSIVPVSCSNANATVTPDLVYSLDLQDKSVPQQVRFILLSEASTFAGTLFVRRGVCGVAASTTEVGCMAHNASNFSGYLDLRLDPDYYYVWVDGSVTNAPSGPFELVVEVTPAPSELVPELCAFDAARTLAFSNDTAMASGSTDGQRNAFVGTCLKGGDIIPSVGSDMVYKFTLDADAWVSAELTRSYMTTALLNSQTRDPIVYFMDSCAAGTVLSGSACVVDGIGNANDVARAGPVKLQAGVDYYVVVDSAASPAGSGGIDYTLVLTKTSVALPDTCADAELLPITSQNPSVSLRRVTGGAGNDTNGFGACKDGANSVATEGPDLVFKLDTRTMGARDMYATVKFDHSNVTGAYLYLWKGACESAVEDDQIGCGKSTLYAELQEGEYYLWVDTNGANRGRGGAFTLDVSLSVPVATGSSFALCSEAQTGSAVVFTNGKAVLGGSNRGRSDLQWGAANSGCEKVNYIGGEAIFRINPGPSAKTLAISVRPSARSLREGGFPGFYVRKNDCASAVKTDEAACRKAPTTGPLVQYATVALSAGLDYFLIVDWSTVEGGDFEATLEYVDPPSGRCSGTGGTPTPLTFSSGSATVRSTAEGAADTTKPCGVAGNSVVYSFTAPAQLSDLYATVSPIAGFPEGYFNLAVREGTCATNPATAPSCGRAFVKGKPADLVVPNLKPNTAYLLFVSASPSGPVGARDQAPFELSVNLTASPTVAVPPNSTCSAAPSLGVLGGTKILSNQTLLGSSDSVSANYITSTSSPLMTNGPDVAFPFSTGSRTKLSIYGRMVDMNALVVVRSSCDATTTLATSASSSTYSQPSSIARNFSMNVLLEQGGYVLFVDSVYYFQGAFDLTLVATPADPADTCSAGATIVDNAPVLIDLSRLWKDYSVAPSLPDGKPGSPSPAPGAASCARVNPSSNVAEQSTPVPIYGDAVLKYVATKSGSFDVLLKAVHNSIGSGTGGFTNGKVSLWISTSCAAYNTCIDAVYGAKQGLVDSNPRHGWILVDNVVQGNVYYINLTMLEAAALLSGYASIEVRPR